MRWIALFITVTACAPLANTELPDDGGALPIDVQGVWGPDAPASAGLRVLQLRPDLSSVAIAFNQAGVFVASDIPFPAVTPFVPRPVDQVSLQLWADVEGAPGVVHDAPSATFISPFAEVIAWGTQDDMRTMNLDIDPTPDAGRAQIRLINTSPGLFYAGFAPIADPPGAPLISAFEGDVSEVVSIPADAVQRWILDINGDGRGDIPYESFQLPAQDGAGNGQYAEIFLIPTGQMVPSTNIPVPFLLVVPLTGPDEAFPVLPAGG